MEKMGDIVIKLEQLKWVAHQVNLILPSPNWVERERQKNGDPEINSIHSMICLMIESVNAIQRNLGDLIEENK